MAHIARMIKCKECGRMYDQAGPHALDGFQPYCSNKCVQAVKSRREARLAASRPAANAPRKSSYSGGSSSANIGGLKLAIPIIGILIIIGLIGAAVNGIQNTFSSAKINIVSASCETQDKFVSIVNKAISEVSVTVIEGEEFTAYSGKARDAVKKREGKYGLYKEPIAKLQNE